MADPDVMAAKLVASIERTGGGVGTLDLTPVSRPTFNDGVRTPRYSSRIVRSLNHNLMPFALALA